MKIFEIKLKTSGNLKPWSWPIFRKILKSTLNKQNLVLLGLSINVCRFDSFFKIQNIISVLYDYQISSCMV